LDISPSGLLLLGRDGVDPKKARKMLGLRSYTSMAALETVLLPSKLRVKRNPTSKPQDTLLTKCELNKSIFWATLKRLGKYVHQLKPSNYIGVSTWSNYELQRKHYSISDLDLKLDFVKIALEKSSGPVLDLGCNQGQYSLLASSFGLKVVASDFDEHSLIKLQSKLDGKYINVMQLNFAYPTPAIGWKNGEHDSFLTKADNYFDLVLCLGLIHHLLVSERIPLPEILDLLASISKRYVLIEWVNPDDEMFSEIASFNAHLYVNLNQIYFEEVLASNFNILDSLSLGQAKRKLYLLKKKSV
jgi:SAM-dependent methyltransferase